MIKEFESIAKKMQIDFERSRGIPHQGVKGNTREQTVTEDFLKKYLPPKYSIGSGLITDSTKNFSKQQDIVIYDGFNLPVLQDFQGSKIFFAEQVYAAIEVKSTLTRTELSDIINKASSISALKRSGKYKLSPISTEVVMNQHARIYFFGFAYESKLDLEQIRDYVQQEINDRNTDWGVSSLVILSDKNGASGLITNVDQIEVKSLKVEPTIKDPIASVITENDGEAIFTFYLQLMQALQNAEANALAPDYLAYARAAGLGKINMAIGKLGIKNLPSTNAIEMLKNAHLLPDEQVILAWHFLMKLGEEFVPGGSHYNDDTCFTIGHEIFVKDPKPSDVWNAANQYVLGIATPKDKYRLSQLLAMLRKVSREDTFLEIASPKPSDAEEATTIKLS